MLKSACETQGLSMIHQSILKKYSMNMIEDYQMIHSQFQILEEIKEKMERKRTYDSYHNSFASNSFSSLPVFTASDDSFRNRFSQEFQNSILDSAMKEVKSNCSEDAYETLATYVSTYKTRENQDLKKDLQRKNNEIQELSALLIMYVFDQFSKQKDNCFLEREMFGLKQREAEVEEEKKKIKRRTQLLNQKEKRLHNVQMSLIFKEKLSLQIKRRYERQRDLNEATEQQLQKIYNQLNKIWSKITDSSLNNTFECSGNCWKQEVMRRCKQQLVEQRRILQQQSKQIEAQYETMRSLSEQIKKVLIIPESGRRTDELPIQK